MIKKIKTLVIIILSVLVMMLFMIIIQTTSEYFQYNKDTIGGLFLVLLTYIAVRIFNAKVNNLSVNKYGFHFREFNKNVILGVSAGMALGTVILFIPILGFGVPFSFAGIDELGEGNTLVKLFITVLLAATWEELYFRGFLFNFLLKNNFGFHLSAITSSLIFSLIHFDSFDMSKTSWVWYVGIILIAYIMVYIYTIANSIWAAVFFHFTWNFIQDLIDILDEKNITELYCYVAVACLGIVLLLLIYYSRTKVTLKKRIEIYTRQITTQLKFEMKETAEQT